MIPVSVVMHWCDPSPTESAETVTCFQPIKYGKGDDMSLSWLDYLKKKKTFSCWQTHSPWWSDELRGHNGKVHVAKTCEWPLELQQFLGTLNGLPEKVVASCCWPARSQGIRSGRTQEGNKFCQQLKWTWKWTLPQPSLQTITQPADARIAAS